jgi:DNA helicase-2/ATP-dependent DNA helicase PcrA
LSATHLNNYLDVTKGGPEHFLLHNLLKLPEAMSPSAVYGSAIHATLQRAHQHLSAHNERRPVEDVLHDFESSIMQAQLSDNDKTKYVERGIKALTTFLDQRYASFKPSQRVERSFSGERVNVDGAVLNGALDLIDIDTDEKTIFVTDYKTGKAVSSWRGRTDYEKIKLHHYEQQLMFYKLLIENSRQFAGYTVTGARIEFVEPDARNQIVLLDYAYNDESLSDFKKLALAVWSRIQSLDFSATTNYEADINGILEFEKSLLENT